MDTSAFDLGQMRRWSDAVFGREHRLEIAIALSRAGRNELYAAGIANRIGVSEGEVGETLRDFAVAELLARSSRRGPVSRNGGAPPKLFARIDDEFWDCIQRLGDQFRREPPSR